MVFTSRILYTRCIPLIFAAPHVSAQQAQCELLIIFFIQRPALLRTIPHRCNRLAVSIVIVLHKMY